MGTQFCGLDEELPEPDLPDEELLDQGAWLPAKQNELASTHATMKFAMKAKTGKRIKH